MTSIVILVIITTSVSINISKVKMREELDASARQIASTLRNLQAQALAARMIKTCRPSGVTIVCELGASPCGASACGMSIVPMAVGMTVVRGASSFQTFADVDVTLEDRRQDASGRETISRTDFATSRAGTAAVTVTGLMADADALAGASIAFERQNGNMRIEACGGSPPLTPACGAGGEPMTLAITLTHARLGKSVVVSMNRLTGKVSID